MQAAVSAGSDTGMNLARHFPGASVTNESARTLLFERLASNAGNGLQRVRRPKNGTKSPWIPTR
jgi:hypothetical protein